MTPWFNRLKNETNKKYYDFLENVGSYSSDTVLQAHHIIPRFYLRSLQFLQDDEKNVNLAL